MSLYAKFVDYLENKASLQDLADCFNGACNSSTPLINCQTGRMQTASYQGGCHTPQELTEMYDKLCKKSALSIGLGFTTKTNPFAQLCLAEILYVIFLYLRRSGLKNEFILLFTLINSPSIKDKDNYFNCPVLESYNLYYDYYSVKMENDKIMFLNKVKTHLPASESTENKWLMACNAATFITAADLMYSFLNNYEFSDDFEAYYKDATYYSQVAINNYSDYAVYYYIKARMIYKLQKLRGVDKIDYEEILKLLDEALKKENDTEHGTEQKNRYNALIAEVTSEKTCDTYKEMEEKSLKRFSAFASLITVVMGLLVKFIGGDSVSVSGGISFVLVLIGAAIILFSILSGGLVEAIYYLAINKSKEKGKEVIVKNNANKKRRRIELWVGLIAGAVLIIVGVAIELIIRHIF